MREYIFKLMILLLCMALCLPVISCNKKEDPMVESSLSRQYSLVDGNMPTIYDSVNFLYSEKVSISPNPNVKVIKLYTEYFFYYNNAAAIATDSQNKGNVVYMLVSDNGEITFKNPISDLLLSSSINSKFFLYALEPDKVLDPSTKVYNTYCIMGPENHPSINIICFSTQYGEKFLVTGNGEHNNYDYDTVYLFSASDFYKKLKIISDDYEKQCEENNSYIFIGNRKNIVTFFSKEELSDFVFVPKE